MVAISLPEEDTVHAPKLHNTRPTNDLHPARTAGLEKRLQADISRAAAEKRALQEAELERKRLIEEAEDAELEQKVAEAARYKSYLEAKRRARDDMGVVSNIAGDLTESDEGMEIEIAEVR
jgi:hypothetical protein